jgi:methionine-gamma-lyase
MAKKEKKSRGIATCAIHGSATEDKVEVKGPCSKVPIFQTANYRFPDVQTAADIFAGKKEGFFYGRFGGLNATIVEEKIAALEGGEAGRMFASGMAAISTTVIALFERGDEIISCRTVYGCTDDLFSHFCPNKLGIKVHFVDLSDLNNLKAMVNEHTKAVFIESPANPTFEVLDIRDIGKFCKEHKLIFMIDNTFASPYNQRPIEMGADVVFHSATKYLNGHSDVVAGAVVGSREIMAKVKATAGLLGPSIAPFDAFLINRGLETFELRMERHNSNAARMAQFLANHKMVAKVHYPGLPMSEGRTLAARQMKGCSGVLSFELKGDLKLVEKFLNYLSDNTFIKLAVSLGSTTTMIQCPALMTHAAIPRKQRLEKGIVDTMIRLAVGIETYEDIEGAFKDAFRYIKGRKAFVARLRRSTRRTQKAGKRLSGIQKKGGKN